MLRSIKDVSVTWLSMNTQIDGAGCKLTTSKTSDCSIQIQPDGTNATGYSENGYARITFNKKSI